ncbi:hypothetical protein [Streptomyces sp. NPDC055134]
MTDVQWARIELFLPDRMPKPGGRWRDHPVAWPQQCDPFPGADSDLAHADLSGAGEGFDEQRARLAGGPPGPT